MKHRKKGQKFGRERDQRRALLKSLASSFFMLERIKTTEAKAKELKVFLEKFITRAKNPTLANTRRLRSFFQDKVAKKITEAAAKAGERRGGYTRVVKLGRRRRDGAKMAILELVK